VTLVTRLGCLFTLAAIAAGLAGCGSIQPEPPTSSSTTKILEVKSPVSPIYIKIQGPSGAVRGIPQAFRGFAHKANVRFPGVRLQVIVVPNAHGPRACSRQVGVLAVAVYGKNQFTAFMCMRLRKLIAGAQSAKP
jgi:hypothetical protein